MKSKHVKVVTTVSAWPEALALQRFLLDKYCEDDFEFIAYIDTPTKRSPQNLWDRNLREKAARLALECCDRHYIFPEELHKDRRAQFPNTTAPQAKYTNERVSDILQYALNEESKDFDGIIIIIDSDMFPINYFSAKSVLTGFGVAGIPQYRGFGENTITYFWNGILFIDVSKFDDADLWSFDCGFINGLPTDTGGHTYFWLAKQNLIGRNNFRFLPHFASLDWSLTQVPDSLPENVSRFLESDPKNENGKFYAELYANIFLHFRAGSNWNRETEDAVNYRREMFFKNFGSEGISELTPLFASERSNCADNLLKRAFQFAEQVRRKLAAAKNRKRTS